MDGSAVQELKRRAVMTVRASRKAVSLAKQCNG